ncbi:MAG: c-type cytochrome biogenesis protein CcmI [Betaproteobacteria bacterium]
MLLWIIVGCLTVAALVPLLWPLLRRVSTSEASDEPTDSELVAVYLDRRGEIEREREAGRLSPAEAELALDELASQMASELPPEPRKTPVRPARRESSAAARVAALALALVIPASALLVYLSTGAPELAGAGFGTPAGEVDERKLDAMISELEQRVRSQPDDGEAWMMLAGARKFRGLYAPANQAFEEALRRVPPSARLLAEFAESLAVVRDGRFEGRPLALLEQALRLDPDDPKAVALMGAAQYQAGNFAEARLHLRRLLDSMPAERPEREALRDVLSRIDAQIGSAPASPEPSRIGAADGRPISGSLSLDPQLASRAAGMRTLFIIARSPSGPRIPIAVSRIDRPAFPLEFRLDDSVAMDAGRKLSTAEEVIIEARLSANGNAIREPGDLFGESAPVKPGTSGLILRIDRVVQP